MRIAVQNRQLWQFVRVMPVPLEAIPDIPVREGFRGSSIPVELTMTLARNVVTLRVMRSVRFVRNIRHYVH